MTIKTLQKLIGLALILISALIVGFAVLFENGDVTAVVFTLPLGLYMLFTKKIILSL